MTNQEAFTTVARHLLAQNAASLSTDGGLCMYRGHKGMKCAVGCLIPDDIYLGDYESLTIAGLIKRESAISELFKDVDISLLNKLQTVHDNHPVFYWEQKLKEIAANFKLQWEL